MSRKPSPTAVGAFVIAGIALALIALTMFGDRRWAHQRARVIVFFDHDVAGLQEGTPVKFRGIEIGSVTEIRISMQRVMRDPERVHIPVILEIDQDRVAAEGAEIDLGDRAQVRALVDQGLRAEIASDNLVAMVRGIRYVALDIKPDTPANLVGEGTLEYPEIPSVRGKLTSTESEVGSFIDRLSKVDVADAVQSFKNVADDAHALLGSPHVKRAVTNLDEVTTKLNRVATELEATTRELTPIIAGAGRLIAPEGTIVTKLDATLEEVAASARALRRLADQLSRDPGSIVRGGRQ